MYVPYVFTIGKREIYFFTHVLESKIYFWLFIK